MKASPEAIELLQMLQDISLSGPVPAIGSGTTTVGMTLLDALGIDYTSSAKPSYKGVGFTARRGELNTRANRVNLFARVPNWGISECGSSAEILDTYGYISNDGTKKLYCTVDARRPNTQGLMLRTSETSEVLNEIHVDGEIESDVAAWRLDDLRARLTESHPESVWVSVRSQEINGREHFHYHHATHTTKPRIAELGNLIQEGTITVDHLISRTGRRVNEKGPLFKIDPLNFGLLFGEPSNIDLMSVDLTVM